MSDTPKTNVWVSMEITIQPRQFEPIKIAIGVNYAFEPFATANELRELFNKATPVILDEMGTQFDNAFVKVNEIRKKMEFDF